MAPKRWFFLFAAALVARAELGWSQTASGWRAYRMADGLPEISCTSVTIGLNGKILVTHPNSEWISELDGYAVRTVSRPASGLTRIGESPGGQLWAVAPEGLKEWKDNDWVLHPVPEIAAESHRGAHPEHSVSLLPVQQGRVLFLLADRLMEFNVEELNRPRTVVLRAASQTQLGSFLSMNLAHDGGLWITGARGLAKVPAPARSLKPDDPWREFLPPAATALQNLRDPREDARGGVMLMAESTTTRQKIGAYFDGQNWTALPFGSEPIRCVWRGPNQEIRAITTDALLQWQDGQVLESEEISARKFFDVAVEPGGVFWVATSDGLFRNAPLTWRVPAPIEKLNAHVRCVVQDAAGRLWFVANGKLHLLQEDSHREFALPDAAQNAPATSFYALGNGALLLALGETLFQFDPANGRLALVNRPEDVRQRKILGAFRDGSVCVQSVIGDRPSPVRLEKFDGAHWQPFPSPLPVPGEAGEFSVMFEAQNGDLWLGGDRGVAGCHDHKWRTFVSTDTTTPEGAESFAELADGKIWCAARDRIWEFDGRNWSLVRAGFDRLQTLVRSRDGSIWAASNAGLHRFWQGAWIENSLEEGLPSPTIHSVYEDGQGRIWAATARGLSRYFPEADTEPPKTEIRKLAEENQKLFEGGTLNLLFTGRDKWKFTTLGRLLYSYRLDRSEWSPFQENNTVYFPDLTAGKHFIQVRALDRNGNLESPTPFEFAVVLPWYRETRLLQIALLGLAVALFFAALAFNRHRQLLRSYAEVEKKIAQRTRELEIANRELLHSQKMNALGTLAAGIAHDFNNILSIIKGSAQIIEENPGDPQKIHTRVDRIKTVVEQGSGIVKAMLGFSRDSEGQLVPCDPNSVVEDTVKLLGDRFLREVEVKLERAPNLPEIPVSRDFVQQILLNFLFNAAESMTKRKQVVLSTQRISQLPPGPVLPPAPAAEYIAISVRDSGCGIAPENMPRIFEPFFTTKSLSARRGTGLGLSMVYELAKKMEAGLAAESIVDQGSTFTLILPVRVPAGVKT